MKVLIPDSKWTPEPFSGCWLWTRAVNRYGYGIVWIGERRVGAHRVMWEQYNGDTIPMGMHVLHRCDTPACVNPAHLFLGTQADNMPKREEDQRASDIGLCKLTRFQVLEIKSDTRQNAKIAREYGVSATQIARIKNGKSWKHLP